VAKLLVRTSPEALDVKDVPWGRTPLHVAVAESAPLPVIECLVRERPQSLREQDRNVCLPLHLVARFARLYVVRFLLDKSPDDAVRGMNQDEGLPLHCPLASGAGLDVVHALIEPFPEALQYQCNKGDVPLHVASQFSSADVGRLLVGTWRPALEVMSIDGEVPMHQVARHARPSVSFMSLPPSGTRP
jgi:hypothetical protein